MAPNLSITTSSTLIIIFLLLFSTPYLAYKDYSSYENKTNFVFNPEDLDGDGFNDPEDLDDDNDGIPDELEYCVFTEDFNDNNLDSFLEETISNINPDGITISYASGNAAWSSTAVNNNRRYIRTVDGGFYNKDVIFEVTAFLPSSNQASGTPFVGLGSGLPSSSYFGEPEHPKLGMNVRVDLNRLYFHDKVVGDSYPTGDSNNLSDVSNTAIRFRITWDASLKTALLEADVAYTGGAFVADFSRTFDGSDNGFTDTELHVYFGGGRSIVYDDFYMEVGCDTDGDTIPDFQDLDSDNDGIYDFVEAGHGQAASSGRLTGTVGTDGIPDTVQDVGQENSGTINYTLFNNDTDTLNDFRDLDSDGDLCPDVIEAGYTDNDSNSELGTDPISVTVSGLVQGSGGYTTPLDENTNNIFDYREAGTGFLIQVQPENQYVIVGESASFSVITDGNVFQWQVSSDNGLNFTDISGANSSSLTIPNTSLTQNNNLYRLIIGKSDYRCLVRTSIPALLIVDTDSDNDAIGDMEDLDDDNDGIPDSIECNGNNSTISLQGDFVNTVTGVSPLTVSGFNSGAVGANGGVNDVRLSTRIELNVAGNDILESSFLTIPVGKFDDGLRIDINGITVLNFNQTHWRFDSRFVPGGLFDSDNATTTGFGWEPWRSEGNTIVIIRNNSIEVMVDTNAGTRQNALRYMREELGTGDNSFIYNPVVLDFQNGIDLDIYNANQATATRLEDVTINATAIVCGDKDSDLVPNNYDLDSDNDGIYDFVEAEHGQAAASGRLTGTVGTDGIPDTVQDAGQENSGTINYIPSASDADLDSNFKDSDSDDDRCSDVHEAGFTDPDNDLYLGTSPVTVNAAGVVTGQGGYTTPADFNANNIPDYTEATVISPSFTNCPADIGPINIDPDSCGAVVTWQAPQVSGNCGTIQLTTNGYNPGDEFLPGVTTVIYTATDSNGNSSQCSFTVTVNDNQPPTITGPSDLTVNTAPGTCSNVVTYAFPQVADNCPANDQTYPIFTDFEVPGRNDLAAVCWQFSGSGITTSSPISGNSSFSTSEIITTENRSLVSPLTYLNGTGEITFLHNMGSPGDNTRLTVSLEDPTTGTLTTLFTFIYTDTSTQSAVIPITQTGVFFVRFDFRTDRKLNSSRRGRMDNLNIPGIRVADTSFSWACPALEYQVIQTGGLPSGSDFPVGITTNTFESTDSYGNTGTFSFNVIVEDREAPVPDNPTLSDITGECTLTITAPTANDNCAGTLTATTSDPVSYDSAGNFTITWNYDDGNGNAVQQTQNVTVTCAPPELDLAITKTSDRTEAAVGDIVEFTVTVTNTSTIEATNISIEDILPNGFSFISVSASEGAFDEVSGEWTIASLGANQSASLFINTSVEDGTNYTNIASLAFLDQTDINPDNDRDEVTITIITPPASGCLTVYNEITPNNDGVNDFFFIECIDDYPTSYLQIFNRWGTKVFESRGYQNNWAGTAEKGINLGSDKDLPAGTYFYTIDLGDSNTPNKSGWIYISR